MVFDINLLTNLSADKIVLLSDVNRFYYTVDDVEFCFYDTPIECVQNSDFVLILRDKLTPEAVISGIVEYATTGEKRVCIIDSAVDDSLSGLMPKQEFPTEFFQNCPVILCVSFGKTALSMTCELLVEGCLQKAGIRTKHLYSYGNFAFVNELKDDEILSDKIADALYPDGDSDVIVVGIDCDGSPVALRNYFDFIELIRPDYVLFQTDFSYDDYQELDNVSKYICNRELDSWVKTRYCSVQNLNIFSHVSRRPSDKMCYDIENSITREMLLFDILSKTAYPCGIEKF